MKENELQRQSLSIHDTDSVPITDENKKLVAVQGEEHPRSKSFSKTMNTA